MTGDMTHIEELAARLTGTAPLELDAGELDATLNWLSGSERAGAGRLIRHLGTPSEQPGLTRRVLRRLDNRLFRNGQLVLDRAFLHAAIDHDERRARFRRLMTAFHPDHHLTDNGWLTPRSQAIHEAWRRFRNGQEDSPQGESSNVSQNIVPSGPQPATSMERRSARLAPEAPGILARLRLRLQRVDHLQGKAMLLIAVIAFLPVVWVYFTHQPYREGLEAISQETPAADTARTRSVASESAESPRESVARQSDGQPLREPADRSQGVSETFPEPITVRVREVAAREDNDLDTSLALTTPDTQDTPESTPGAPAPPTDELKPDPDETRERSWVTGRDHSSRATEEATDASDRQLAVIDTPPASDIESPADPVPDADPSIDADDEVDLETELRIAQLLGSYQDTFERGQLDGLLGHFSDSPRENRNEGRRWLRQNYQALFENSTRRRLYIEVKEISPHEKGWQVDARFVLQVDYPQRRSMRVDRPVRYLILEEHEQYRIASIEY